jgi:hypothetical protein
MSEVDLGQIVLSTPSIANGASTSAAMEALKLGKS